MMETIRPENQRSALDLTREKMLTSYEFSVFAVLPGIEKNLKNIKKLARQFGVDEELAREFAELLFGAGLWSVKDDEVTSHFELLDLGDLSVRDYLSMTVAIVSQLSDARSHAFETISVATNRTLIRELMGKVNLALREFHDQSLVASEKDCVFSWTHTGVLQVDNKKSEPKEV